MDQYKREQDVLSSQVIELRAQLDVTVARERANCAQLSTVQALTAEVARLRANFVEMEEEMESVEEMHAIQLAQVKHTQSLTGALMRWQTDNMKCRERDQAKLVHQSIMWSRMFTGSVDGWASTFSHEQKMN